MQPTAVARDALDRFVTALLAMTNPKGAGRLPAWRHKSTPLAIASSLRIRSLRSAISIRAAPSRAPPSISGGRRPVSSSRLLSASQSCQPLSVAPAITRRPMRALAANSNSWLIVASLLDLIRSLFAQALDLGREQIRFVSIGGDALEHLHPLAQFCDLALERGIVRRCQRLLVAHHVRRNAVTCAMPGLEQLGHADQRHDRDDGRPEGHCTFPLLSTLAGSSRSRSISWPRR